MQPTAKMIATTLSKIEAAERDPNHPRALARQAVAKWRSDAESERLPVTNITDSGAPLLRVNEVISRSEPHHAIIAKTAKNNTFLTALSQNLLQRLRWLTRILSQSIQRIFPASVSED